MASSGTGGAAARLYVSVGADVKGAVSGLKATDAQLKKTAASAKAMDAAMVRSTRNARAATTSMAGLGATTAATAKKSQQVAPAVSKTSAAAGRLGKAAKSAGSSLSSMAGGMTGTQVAALGVAYGFGKSVKMAADFDSQMRNVNSIAGLSEGNFQRLKSSVLGLAGPTAQAPATLADGMYQLVSSGFNAREAMTVLKSSAIAASAGLTTTETATTAVAGVLNAYQLKAKDAAQVSDDLFQTVNLGVLSFEDLAQGIGPVLPFASRLGVSLKQVGAMTATLTKAGIPAAESFTYMKGAMAQLVKPTDDLKGKFKDLGVSSGRELVSKTGSLQAALQALYKSVGSNDRKFAQLFPDIRGLSAAFTATGSGAKGAAADLRDFNNTAGKTQQVFKEQKKGEGFVWKQLGTDIKQAGIDIGSNFAPEIRAAGNALHGFFNFLHQNKSTVSTVMKGLASPISLPIKGIKSAMSAGGAGIKDVKANVKIKVEDGQASKAIANTKRGLGTIPGIKNVKIRVQSNADVVARRTRTELDRSGRPMKIKVEKLRSGDVNTIVGQPKPIKVPVKAEADKAKGDVKSFQESLSGLKPKKAKVSAPGATAAAGQAKAVGTAVNNIPGFKKVDIKINVSGKVPKLASGGTAPGGLAEVNERGAESITAPGGHTMMLGDGKRQVMALPTGWHVNTAAETKGLFGDIPGMAKGGWVRPKRKKGEKAGAYRQRVKDSQSRYNENIDRRSGIRDSRSDKSIAEIPLTVDKDGNTVENTAAIDAKNVSRAKRHLAEAEKKKGRDRAPAVAAAKAELAQAKKTQALNAAQVKAVEDNTEALKAHAEAISTLSKSIDEWNRIAWTTHTVSDVEIKGAIRDIANRGMGGDLGANRRTLGPISGATY